VDITYRLAVGSRLPSNASGTFTLALATTDTCPDLPTNKECASAKILNVSSFPLTELGSNQYASSPISPEALSCPAVSSSSKGVWFQLNGDGSCIEISLDLSDFKTLASVYVGPDCDELHCVREETRSQFGDNKRIEIETVPGLNYFIFVGGQFSEDVDYGVTFSKKTTCGASGFCTLCADGNYPNRNLTFDGKTCAELESQAAFADPVSDDCTLAHIMGAQACGCPANINETGACTICPDGSEPGNESNNTLFGFDTEPTCSSWSRIAAVDGNTTCDFIQTKAFYCECPKAEGCEFCVNGTDPTELILPGFIFQGNLRYAGEPMMLRLPDSCTHSTSYTHVLILQLRGS